MILYIHSVSSVIANDDILFRDNDIFFEILNDYVEVFKIVLYNIIMLR